MESQLEMRTNKIKELRKKYLALIKFHCSQEKKGIGKMDRDALCLGTVETLARHSSLSKDDFPGKGLGINRMHSGLHTQNYTETTPRFTEGLWKQKYYVYFTFKSILHPLIIKTKNHLLFYF